jgi:hypothetical protein
MKCHRLLAAAVLLALVTAGCSKPAAEPAPQKTDAQIKPVTGPNRVLLEYLGDPVAPPATLDAAYTKQGLAHGMQTAAQAAGISLVKLEMDDSEFPCLVGIVCANRDDRQKLEDQISRMPGYNYNGGWGGNDMRAMNLVPVNAWPNDARQQIWRRTPLREQILGDKISGRQ